MRAFLMIAVYWNGKRHWHCRVLYVSVGSWQKLFINITKKRETGGKNSLMNLVCDSVLVFYAVSTNVWNVNENGRRKKAYKWNYSVGLLAYLQIFLLSSTNLLISIIRSLPVSKAFDRMKRKSKMKNWFINRSRDFTLRSAISSTGCCVLLPCVSMCLVICTKGD